MRCLLNTIIPKSECTLHQIKIALSNSLLEYKKIKEAFPDFIDGIVTTGNINSVQLDSHTLEDCLRELEREIRDYAYSIFQKYPIETYFDINSYLEQINSEYFLLLGERFDGMFLHVISQYQEGGIACSLNLHHNLAKNTLQLSSESDQIDVNNMYGLDINTEYVKSLLTALKTEQLTNLERIKELLNNPVSSINKFDREFEKLSPELQNIIFAGFQEIIEDKKNHRITPETLLKNVTPEKEKTVVLHELKIRDPIAKRIYFSVIADTYYLASIEDKPLKDRKTTQQTTHIKNAISKIKELKATSL